MVPLFSPFSTVSLPVLGLFELDVDINAFTNVRLKNHKKLYSMVFPFYSIVVMLLPFSVDSYFFDVVITNKVKASLYQFVFFS